MNNTAETPKHTNATTRKEHVISTEGGALAAAVEKPASLPLLFPDQPSSFRKQPNREN